jgi:hypothetical protein
MPLRQHSKINNAVGFQLAPLPRTTQAGLEIRGADFLVSL